MAVADGGALRVVIADASGAITAIDPATGQSAWSVTLPAPAGEQAFVVATPVVVGGLLVVEYHTVAVGTSPLLVTATRLRHRVAVVDIAAQALSTDLAPFDLAASIAGPFGDYGFEPGQAMARGALVNAVPPGGTLGRDQLDGASSPVAVLLPSGKQVLVYPTKDGALWLVDYDRMGVVYAHEPPVASCGTTTDPCATAWSGTIVTQPALTTIDGAPAVVVPTFMPDTTHAAGVFALKVEEDEGTPSFESAWQFPAASDPAAITSFRGAPSRAIVAVPAPASRAGRARGLRHRGDVDRRVGESSVRRRNGFCSRRARTSSRVRVSLQQTGARSSSRCSGQRGKRKRMSRQPYC